MKLVILKSDLKNGLLTVDRASGNNPNLPVLSSANFNVSSDKIKITATNLELAISCVLPGKVIEGGEVNIPISTLLSLLNNLHTERINLEAKGSRVKIQTDNYEANLAINSDEEFPIIPKIKNNQDYLEIDSGFLKDSLAQVLIAAQASELRPELSSILFDFSIDSLRLVATDSFRLAEKTLAGSQFKTNYIQNFRFLLPLKVGQEILRLAKDEGGVKMYRDENQILVRAGEVEMISRLVEGNFPDYSSIIPKNFTSEISVKREEFMNALKLAGVLSNHSGEVRIAAAPGGKVIEVLAAGSSGENKYLLPAKIKTDFGEISFNWRYLFDGLKALRADEVWVGLNEEDNKPTLIKSPNEASYFYIVMPILRA